MLLGAIGPNAEHIQATRFDEIYQLAAFTLLEQHLTRPESYIFWRPISISEVRNQFDDPVCNLGHAMVMCGDYDNASGNSQFPQKFEYAFDLNVIKVCRRFVSHDERRVLHECSGNRDSLLLAT